MIARPPLAVPLLALAGFLTLLGLTGGGWDPLGAFDATVSEAFRAYGTGHPRLVEAARIGTDAAATVPFVVSGLLISLALAGRGQRRPAILCAAVTAAVPLLWGLLHWVLHRPRPLDGFVVVASNGFPSGHTSNGAAAALVAVLLLWPGSGRTGRVVSVLLATLFVSVVGITRLLLLAHWPVDVLGGCLLALATVPLVGRLVGRIPSAVDRVDRADASASRR